MTIKLLTPRGAIPINAIITLDAATETSLVGEKVATTDLTGGFVWTGPVDRSTAPADQAYARASAVSGAGNWVLNGASVGASSQWFPFRDLDRIAFALDSGSTSTTASVDYSFDGGQTTAGQAYTLATSSSTAFETGYMQLSPYFIGLARAARDAGTFTGYYARVTVLTGGPLSVFKV